MSGSRTKVTPTRGESLYLWRRRKGLKQYESAETFGVSVDTMREWETDHRKHDQPRKHLGALSPREVCLLLRRRAGLTQRELAAQIGCSPVWVVRMEAGTESLSRLRAHWGV